MLPAKLAKRGCFLLLLLIAAFYFYGLGVLPFVGPDEPRYAQVAREMFLRRDLITPTLAGFTWFEKPVLLYWLMGLSYKLFGITEFAARLGPALCGVLTIAAVYFLGTRLERLSDDPGLRNLGCWSALVVATIPGIVVFSRGASFDIVVTMTITWSLVFYLLAHVETDEPRRRWSLIGFYVFVGVSLLAKGLVGVVIPFGVIFFYLMLRRSLPERWFIKSLSWGLPLTILVAGVWYVPVIVRHGWYFIDDFFIQHHFARYLSNRYSHPQSVFFYVLIIFPLALPWLIFALEALAKARHWNWRGNGPLDKFRVFTLAWLLMPLLFFSFSGSKLPGYILPILPAVALLAGERVTRFVSTQQKFSTMRAVAGTLLGFATGAIIYASISSMLSVGCVLLTVAPLFLAGIGILLFFRFKALTAASVALAIPLTFILALNCEVPALADDDSSRHLLELADAQGYSSAPIFNLHVIDRGSEFYGAGRVVYDSSGQPMKYEGAHLILNEASERKTPVLVIVPLQYVYQLAWLDDAEAKVIAKNAEVAIVALRSLKD